MPGLLSYSSSSSAAASSSSAVFQKHKDLHAQYDAHTQDLESLQQQALQELPEELAEEFESEDLNGDEVRERCAAYLSDKGGSDGRILWEADPPSRQKLTFFPYRLLASLDLTSHHLSLTAEKWLQATSCARSAPLDLKMAPQDGSGLPLARFSPSTLRISAQEATQTAATVAQ